VVSKGEVSEQGVTPRFVVPEMEQARTTVRSRHLSWARGQMENDLKAPKLSLQSDRPACHRFEAKQFRRLFHAAAYVWLDPWRRAVFKTTPWAAATLETIPLRLLTLGARVQEYTDGVKISLPSSCPGASVLRRTLTVLAHVRWTSQVV
jgi:Transposase DDE domain group 1